MKSVDIKNKKARFNYEWLETFTCGMVLSGTEVKSVKMGKASIAEAYCYLSDDASALYIKGMHIAEWTHGNRFNHDPIRERKLLLNAREIQKIQKMLKDVGITIIPVRCFVSEKGWIKLEIAVARGKKNYDKRQSLKDKDMKRDLARLKR